MVLRQETRCSGCGYVRYFCDCLDIPTQVGYDNSMNKAEIAHSTSATHKGQPVTIVKNAKGHTVSHMVEVSGGTNITYVAVEDAAGNTYEVNGRSLRAVKS